MRGARGPQSPDKNVQCKTTHSHTCRHILARRLPCHCNVQTVCLHKYVTTRLQSPAPQFDVSFPAKLLKIVAAGGEIFSLKFTEYRLAAGLCPDPLGELKRSPGPTSRNKGPTSKGREEKGRGNGRGKSRRGREEGKGEGREGGRALPPTVSSNNAHGYKGYADIRWGSAG